MTLLNGDLFVIALTGDDVASLRVARADGEASGASAEPVSIDGTPVLVATISAPEQSLPLTNDGLPVPPALDLHAGDSTGSPLDLERLDFVSTEREVDVRDAPGVHLGRPDGP